MSRRRKRQAPLPLHDMSQAKRREFAIFPSRSDSSEPPPGTCSETVFEISDSASATTTAYEQPHSSPQADVVHNRHEIAWKVPIVTCSQIPVEQGWFCIGIININLEGCSNASYILSTDTLHFGWTVGGELFVEAGTGETAVWLEGRPANADTHLLRSAESLNYLVVRQNLAQVCLVDVSPPFIALGVLVSEVQLDTSAEFPRGVARLITEHFGNLVKALYAEVTWPGQLSSSPYDAKNPCLSITERILQLYKEGRQRRHQLCLHGATGFNPASIPGLTAVLREYQFDAVCWMVEREGCPAPQVDRQGELHPLWVELPSFTIPKPMSSAKFPFTQPNHIYFSPYLGSFSLQWQPKPLWPRGGILADEMGLGKTVEVLALVLSHKWQGRGEVGVTIGPNSWEMEEAEEHGSEAATPMELGIIATQTSSKDFKVDPLFGNVGDGVETIGTMLPLQCETPGVVNAPLSNIESIIHIPGATVSLPLEIPGTTVPLSLETPGATVPQTPGTIVPLPLETPGTTVPQTPGTTVSLPLETPETTVPQTPGTTVSFPLETPGTTVPLPLETPGATVPQTPGTIVPLPLETPGTTVPQTPGTTVSLPLEIPGATVPQTPGTTVSLPLETPGATVLQTPGVPPPDTSPAVHMATDYVPSGEDSNSMDIVRCVCGATSEGSYKGEFVQCEVCLLWQHSNCVGFKSSKMRDYVCSGCRKDEKRAGDGKKAVVDPISCMCGALSMKATKGSVNGSKSSVVQCKVCQQLHHTACINYQPNESDDFVCIKCLLENPLFAKATLIVVPESIAPQWSDEIIKHTRPGTLRVLRYTGVAEQYFSPQQLASYDIVIATYESLRKEIHHVNSHEFSHILRHKKRYSSPPSPLPAVHWWRVCLDEAQMVESTHATAAEMMQRIKATNRWCVTGTPIQHDLIDLHGLVLFMGAEPYCQINWFNQLIWYPYLRGDREPAIVLFSNLMWRNSKQDVAKELRIPEQSEKVHWLSFGALETYFYGREQETCAAEASKVLVSLPPNTLSLSNLLHSTVVKVMAPLHRLRKACCHPQIVRNGYLLAGKGSLTMPQLLKKLILQAKQEGREALRQLVSAFNGLAAMHIIDNEFDEAIGKYREAMLCWQEHEEHLECDKLQRIHTMENLADLLRAGHADGSHTLRDEELQQCAADLRAKYAEKAELLVTSSSNELQSLRRDTEEAKRKADLLCAQYEQGIAGGSPQPSSGNDVDMQLEAAERIDMDTTDLQSSAPAVDSALPPPLGGACPQSSSEGGACLQLSSEGGACPQSSSEGGACLQLSSEGGACPQSSSEGGACLQLSSEGGACPQPSSAAVQLPEEEKSSGIDSSSSSINGATMATSEEGVTKHKSKNHVWWVQLLDWALDRGKTGDLLRVIKEDLSGHPDRATFYLNFTDVFGLQYILYNLMGKLEDNRSAAQTSLEQLLPTPSFALLAAANECHLRPNVPKGTDRCQLCLADGLVVQHERVLFAGYQAGDGVDGRAGLGGDGGRAPGLFEKLLRSLLHFAKAKRAPEGLIAAGKGYMDVFDALKKEYEVMRTLSLALDKRLCVHDELRMAASRYRMASKQEQVMWVNDPLVVKPAEVHYRKALFRSELEAAKSGLKRCLGQTVYLQGLSKFEGIHHPTKQETCPICMSGFGDKWGMFPCGHPLCVECMVEMVRKERGGGEGHHSLAEPRSVRVMCPLCRLRTTSDAISYVQQQEEAYLGGDNVQGEWSTKITAVVGVLLDIQSQDKGAKSLVFSSWSEVLGIIAQALKANGVRCVLVESRHNFQTNLALFKKSPDINVLLMPIYAGSKGLNIVEATHVLLVEPMLNTGAELQAIGRVHRMGQTRPTTVHRFYVKHTVEERIHHLFSSSVDRAMHIISNESETSLSLSEIQDLFHLQNN